MKNAVFWDIKTQFIPPIFVAYRSVFLVTDPEVSGFDSQRCQIFWESLDLERGPARSLG
jgi:hypothetical protein